MSLSKPSVLCSASHPSTLAAHASSSANIHTAPTKAGRIILNMLARMSVGQLVLTLPSNHTVTCGQASEHDLTAHLTLHDWQVFSAILRGGDIAFAELYMQGRISTPDLPHLLKVLVANRQSLEHAVYGSWWGNIADRLLHWLRRNSKNQARKNIAAHYDLGNAFYSLWLDPSMTYSSALFNTPYQADPVLDEPQLNAAQYAKYQRVLDELQLTAEQHILEIGCGWGGFSSQAANAGLHVTGLTLSQEQLQFAQTSPAQQALSQRIQLKLQDYRDEGVGAPARYDAVASIEMFEAVGEQYWPSYFDCIARNLKPGGRACIQTIVIRDELFKRYRKGTDFIQRYIFPGGMLPSPQRFTQAANAAGLQLSNSLSMGLDYARTLAIWRVRFLRQLPAIRAQGYSEQFVRMWEFYLAYCEAGFVQGDIDVIQFTLFKPTKDG